MKKQKFTISEIIRYSCKGVTNEEVQKAKQLADAAPELLEMLIKISNIENHAFALKGFDVKRLKSEVNEAIQKATQ